MNKTAIRNKIGMRIKGLRQQAGITQEKFALMTGINRSYLADIEKGNRNFGFDTPRPHSERVRHIPERVLRGDLARTPAGRAHGRGACRRRGHP